LPGSGTPPAACGQGGMTQCGRIGRLSCGQCAFGIPRAGGE
jgi:hypothetical protein